MALNIVLVEPEIPQNTGSIARTCALTATKLHLVRPLGFSVSDKFLKRAGLDYWNQVEIYYYDNFLQVLEKYPKSKFYYATTKSEIKYSDLEYEDNSFFVFGKETKGLPKTILEKNSKNCISIPMKINTTRSLNLSNSVNIILYEALRQIGFPFLK